ncbi:MAG: tetratricopeptide repeat protein [Bacteroidales bacterium]|nr:tetratricopeptide repeat protein [Bacteroidales bacterium]
MIRIRRILAVAALCLMASSVASAQVDRRDVRAGNRRFAKGKYAEAEVDYRKAAIKDTTSLTAAYNLASALYREGNYEEAGKSLSGVSEAGAVSERASDFHFNTGDVALQKKDYQAAVDAFRKSLLLNPDDLEAKENYIYARKMLQNQQNQQNQDQNQQDQNQQNQNQDQNRDQQNQDQNQQGQDQDQNQNQQEQKLSSQQAQQMLQAVQAQEKKTQDKVNKEKAAAMKSRQKEKNW